MYIIPYFRENDLKMKIMTKSLGWAKDNWQAMLVFSYLLLVPFSRAAAAPTAVMAIAGLVLLLRGRVDYKSSAVRLFIVVFLCFWLPIVLSLPGAYASAASAKVAANFLQYLFMGLFIIDVFKGEHLYSRHRWFISACSVVIAFWVIDALFQALTGFNTLGYGYSYGALNGIFGPDHPKMGIYLAAVCSLLFVQSSRFKLWQCNLLAIAGTSLVIMLAGRRGGWIMLALVMSGYAFWLLYEQRLKVRWVLWAGLLLFIGLFATYQLSDQFRDRIDTSLLVFEGNSESIDIAISLRLPIWNTALAIIADRPLTGVGARGFRYAYRDYADSDDPFIQDPTSLGAFYPHQILLELGAETGLIGIIGYLIICGMLLKQWWNANIEGKRLLLPYGLALVAILFPLNTHYATYSSHWSSLIFWVVSLYCAAVSVPKENSQYSTE